MMVIDSQGEGFSDSYAALLPNAKLRGIDPKGEVLGHRCHPHGLQAGYYAGILLDQALGFEPGSVEIVFVRIFERDASPSPDSNDWMLDVIAKERPDVINRSWGMEMEDTQWGNMVGKIAWGKWVAEYNKLQEEIGFVDFGAAGNSGDWDADDDVNFPQKLMPNSNVIGSSRRDGVPSEWSSDGQAVQCVAWGDRIWLRDNYAWDLGSGTSFSSPKMAGLCAALRLDTSAWRLFVEERATRPKGYEAVRSNKWGKGNMEDEFQKLLRKVDAARHPVPVRNRIRLTMQEKWHDFERL